MKVLVLLAALVPFVAAADEDWRITPELRKQCAEAGGCILTIPDGRLVPLQAVEEAMQGAFKAGVEAGKDQADKEGAAYLRKHV